MSLPNYLAKIKSSGIYRFVWDKSEVAGTQAETLRLVVGYSEKGPFNTPTYIESQSEFISIYGDISKKMERYGVFFNRLALQALETGPILALNLKKFANEKVDYSNFDATEAIELDDPKLVEDVYDTTRFWTLEPEKLKDNKMVSLAITDSVNTSKTIFMRGVTPDGYNITTKTWYATVLNGEELPSYLQGDEILHEYFAEIYVFEGKFTKKLCQTEALSKYFTIDGDNIYLKPTIKNAFGEDIDALQALAEDENSNFLKSYRGILLPNFKDANNAYISLDLVFNQDNDLHKMLMYIDVDQLYEGTADEIAAKLKTLNTSGIDKVAGIAPTAVSAQIETGYIEIDNTVRTLSASGATATLSISKCVEGDDHKWTYDESGDLIYVSGTVNVDSLTATLSANDDTPLSFSVGEKFLAKDGKQLATVLNVDSVDDGSATTYTLSFDVEPATDLVIVNVYSAYANGLELVPTYFEGYTYEGSPAGTSEAKKLAFQNNQLKVLTDYKGIRVALTNSTDIEYRYIVDTFDAYIQQECHKELALIAKEKANALALLNFPSMHTFANTKISNFKDSKGNFNVKYIASNKAFTLVSEGNGASYASYNTCLTYSDGTLKTFIPSAGAVSNKFMEKYLGRQPYYIVAGPNYGRIVETGIIGPDYNFSRADLDVLEPMGVNAMVYRPRVGTYINSNQTAKQNPVTGLSKINIRELVIYLQDEIHELLQSYQWEFNTQTLRDTIKAKADVICENVKNNGGIYEYLNVCDESNNTTDVIDNEMIVLSTSIEPARGCGKMVQELTIYKTGGISALIK